MEDKPNYYAVIPAGVRYDKNLPPMARLLYGEIAALANKKGYCWATNKYFSELYEVSIRSVTEWLSNLEESGHIKMDNENSPRRIILGGVEENFQGGRRKVLGGRKISSEEKEVKSEFGGLVEPQNRDEKSLNTTYNTTISVTNKKDSKESLKPTIREKPWDHNNSSADDMVRVPVDSEGRERPVKQKKEATQSNYSQIETLSSQWVDFAAKYTGLSRTEIPVSTFGFVVNKAIKRDNLTLEDCSNLIKYYFGKENLSENYSTSYKFCFSEDNIAQWRASKKSPQNRKWNHISAASEMPL